MMIIEIKVFVEKNNEIIKNEKYEYFDDEENLDYTYSITPK